MKFVRFKYLSSFVLVFSLICCGSVSAQIEETQNLLIRNVTMIDPAGNAEDRLVNILIRDQKLEVVTEDKISRNEADQVIDASGGYIVGKLEVGELPNFIVLSSDPREDFEVMLDTKTYASFAVHDGRVVKNELEQVAKDENRKDKHLFENAI